MTISHTPVSNSPDLGAPGELAGKKLWDVVVIGAGAAGLLAATRAAERGLRTLLLEKNAKPGVKILMSGGTRCNLTHACPAREIIAAFGPQGRFLHSALATLGPEDVVQLIEAEGVPTKIEETGKIFPVSDRAIDVQQALLRRLQRSGAQLQLRTPVDSISRKETATGPFFEVQTTSQPEPIHTRQLIVTTGGQSYPGSGTTGDAYAWARSWGHTVTPLRPALVPLTTSAEWIPPLRGITLPDVQLTLHDPALSRKPRLACERGSLLLAHFGLSGPIALDLSRHVSGHPEPARLLLTCDFTPDITRQEWEQRWQATAGAAGSRTVVGDLEPVGPRRLTETLLTLAGIPVQRRLAELKKTERTALIDHLKELPLPLTGTLGYEKAEVTAGGIGLDEVDSRTMQSRLIPGLYWAGEVLDLDGRIGGFNFQAAFSTGWLAGESVTPAA